MNKIAKSFIEAWKPLFDLEPELKAIPVYAWGRFYKYELRGEPFECGIDEGGFSSFIGINGMQPDYKLQKDLLLSLDEKYNDEDGPIYTGKIGDYSPSRSSVVRAFDFDSRGGNCLIVVKKDDGEFEVVAVDCDSPE
jgi:hypothetical protein